LQHGADRRNNDLATVFDSSAADVTINLTVLKCVCCPLSISTSLWPCTLPAGLFLGKNRTPDGRRLITGMSDGTVLLWDVPSL
jgi:hypothetical protein